MCAEMVEIFFVTTSLFMTLVALNENRNKKILGIYSYKITAHFEAYH